MKKDWTTRYQRVVAPVGYKGATKRTAHYCNSKNAAKELRADIARWKREREAPPRAIMPITEDDQRWLGYLKNRLGTLDILPEVVDHYERTVRRVTELVRVPTFCDLFLEQPRNPRWQAELRHLINAFKFACFTEHMNTVTSEQIRSFLKDAPSLTQARNRYRALSVLFKFAIERRAIAINPLAEVKRPKVAATTPGILTPEDYATLLRAAPPELIPYLAIAGFAGLRRSELVAKYPGEAVLQWQDVLFDRKLILVRPEVAKTTRRRFVPIEPALEHWLNESMRRAQGPVIAHGEGWLKSNLAKLLATVNVDPPHNALRHSFASYYLARTGAEGVGRLAVVMGNSESVSRAHYVESLAPGDGDAWFATRRSV